MNNKAGKLLVPELRFPEFQDSKAWKETNFGKLLTIGSGKDYKHLSVGDIPVYGTGGYMLSVNDYLYDGDSVCIGRKGTIDKPVFLSGKFWTVDTLFYTHSFKKCLPKFIHLCFQTIDWLKHNEASGVPSLSKTTIAKIDIQLPELTEQQKITDCLSSLDDLITSQAKKIETLEVHKKGLMQLLFPAEGETVPRLRFPGFRGAKHWKEKRLDALAEITTGNKNTQDKIDNGKYPFFVRSQKIEYINSYSFDGESILTAGDGVGVGKVFHYINGKFDLHQRCYRLGDFDESVLGGYLFAYFQEKFIDQVSKYSAKNSVDSVRMEMIAGMNIPLPSRKEQQKILDGLSSLGNLITFYNQKLEALYVQKKGLLQGLFPVVDGAAE